MSDKIRSRIQCSITHAQLTLGRLEKEAEEVRARIKQLTAMLDCDHEWETWDVAGDILTCAKCGFKIYADDLETC